MAYFTNYKINDHIYQIKDPMGVLTTLIIGKQKCLLIDTAYGIGDLKSHLQTLTNLPIVVVNSHGHMDHTGGNYQFSQVFISKKDIYLCTLHNSHLWREANIKVAKENNLLDNSFDEKKYLNENEGNLCEFSENQIFDLGSVHIKVINMEGHTTGSVGFLIEEDKILVTSDAACPFVWLFLKESTTVQTYISMLKRVLMLDFNNILVGHGNGKLLDKSRMKEFYTVACSIDLDKSVKVTFNNFNDLNSYCYTTYKMYDQDGAGIVFDPNKLK